jgi:Flp pilus assembly protein TadB
VEPSKQRFSFRWDGDAIPVIGLGIAFIVVGIVFLFLIPWVGIAVGVVGLALAIIWVAGFGRRAAKPDAYAERLRS